MLAEIHRIVKFLQHDKLRSHLGALSYVGFEFLNVGSNVCPAGLLHHADFQYIHVFFFILSFKNVI